jgi:hypothetical protein
MFCCFYLTILRYRTISRSIIALPKQTLFRVPQTFSYYLLGEETSKVYRIDNFITYIFLQLKAA